MLVIENKRIQPVNFEWVDGKKKVELQLTQMSVSDRLKLSDMHTSIIENKELEEAEQRSHFLTSRIMCSVKDLKGNHFFTDSVEKVNELLTGDVLFQLSAEVTKLNPINTDSIDDAKK